MATLQKTYKGDLSGAIAGVLWSRIKEANTKKELEKSNASDDIKEAAVELRKEDPSDKSIPVQDKDLRDSVVRIFGKLEGRLFSLQGKANNISGKVTTLAGGIADTQDLIINQNQLLEDKFDIILKNIGAISSIEKKNQAEAELDRVEAELEKGFDLSGTFAYEKTNAGSFGMFGRILSGILGNRFTAGLISQISKSLIPKTTRARLKLIRNATQGAIKRSAQKLAGTNIARRALSPFALYGGKKVANLGGRRLLATIGKIDVGGVGVEALLGRTAGREFIRRKGGKFLVSLDPTIRKIGSKLTVEQIANLIIESKTIDANAKRKMVKTAFKSAAKKKGKKVIQKSLPGLAEGTGKKVTKRFAAKTGSKALNKALSQTDGMLLRALQSPAVQKEILKKIGEDGAKRIGIKATAGGVKGGFPLFGTGYAVIEGLVRLALGDPAGMLLSFGSGIPAAGWGFAIIDILRDIDKDAYATHLKPNLPIPSDENLAGYFQQAFGLAPDQYERGNIDIKSSMIGNNTSAISEILGVTQAFGDVTGFSGEAAKIILDSGLGSYSVPNLTYNFDVGKFSPSKNIKGIQKSEEEKELKMIRKKEKEENQEDESDEIESQKEVDPTGGDPTDLRNVGKNIKNWWKNTFGGGGIGGEVLGPNTPLPAPGWGKKGNFTPKPMWQKPLPAGGTGRWGTSIKLAQTPLMGGDASTIEFYGQQGRDRSGEPGVDFSFKDFKNNYNLFPGYVLETGLLYGKGYGNVVVVRSIDPSNGKQFDALYSHFPDDGIAVKVGQQVAAGDLLGSVGFVSVDTPGVPQIQPNNAGNMSGWHTSVDFFEPDSATRYSNADKLINLVVGARNSTPHGLLEKLKPVTSDNKTSLNSIEANTNLALAMTSKVESGSSERLMTQRQATKKNPIVIVNNQIISNNTSPIIFGNNNDQEDDLFEAFNLARHTV